MREVFLTEKTPVRCLEVGEVREDGRPIHVCHPKPCCECRGVLIHGCRGDPPAVAPCVVWTTESQRGELPVKCVSFHGVAHDHLVAAPGVVCSAVRARLECSAEFGERESCHFTGDAEFLRGFITLGTNFSCGRTGWRETRQYPSAALLADGTYSGIWPRRTGRVFPTPVNLSSHSKQKSGWQFPLRNGRWGLL